MHSARRFAWLFFLLHLFLICPGQAQWATVPERWSTPERITILWPKGYHVFFLQASPVSCTIRI